MLYFGVMRAVLWVAIVCWVMVHVGPARAGVTLAELMIQCQNTLELQLHRQALRKARTKIELGVKAARMVGASLRAGRCVGYLQGHAAMQGFLDRKDRYCVPASTSIKALINQLLKDVGSPRNFTEPTVVVVQHVLNRRYPCK